ncbi:MAG: GPP34 family phosphoprotein [Nocardioides sp.]|nr:GPP34 family phosphoprotein [Nocardioides sp.]
MLIAEDLLLLLVDDATGRFLVDSTKVDNVLAGAVLVELATTERLGFPPEGSGVKRGRLVVVDPTPPGDPLLDRALATVAASRPAQPEQLIATLRKRLRATLLERLSAAGALRRSTRKVIGILPCTTWPAADSSHKRELRADLQAVLVTGATPDSRTAALVSLLAAVNAAHKVVDGDKKLVLARAKDIAAGDWAGDAVNKAIDAVNAGIAVIIAAGAATAGGSSS